MASGNGRRQGQHVLLQALNHQARTQWAREAGFYYAAKYLLLFLIVTFLWYIDLEKSLVFQSIVHRLVGVFIDLPVVGEGNEQQQEITLIVSDFVRLCRPILRASAICLFSLSALSLIGATSTTLETSSQMLDDLGDEQRRLLGLEPLTRKPFTSPDIKIRSKMYQTPSSSTQNQTPSQTPDLAVRNPWSDLTPVGPYISPPGAFLRDRITPGSSGKRRRHPAYAGGGGNLTFGSSAEKKMHEYLEEYKQELQTPTTQTGEVPIASTISPSTHRIGPYKESPVGASSGLLVGKTGSPSERWDAAEWNRTLQRLGLDSYTMSQYVDNLRGALYTEIVSLMDSFSVVVDTLEGYGVPRDLLLDRKPASQTGHSLDDLLLHAQNYDPARVKEFIILKRVFKEGYNWKDLFDYVISRLDELTEDSYLSRYDWARGGAIRDKNVSVELPTDADILMHIFLWRCDSLSEHRMSEGDQPFVKQHFLQVLPGEESRSLRGRNLIMRHGTTPPHFSVVENGAMYRIPRGKDNCFIAIVIFLYLARRDKWLPTYNQGYRRLLESVFGSAIHPSPSTSTRSSSSYLKSSPAMYASGR